MKGIPLDAISSGDPIYFVCHHCQPPVVLTTPDWKDHFPEVHGKTKLELDQEGWERGMEQLRSGIELEFVDGTSVELNLSNVDPGLSPKEADAFMRALGFDDEH